MRPSRGSSDSVSESETAVRGGGNGGGGGDGEKSAGRGIHRCEGGEEVEGSLNGSKERC